MVSRHELEEVIRYFDKRISLMATQADVDTLTSQVNADSNELAALKTAIDGFIAAHGATVDLSALQAAVATLDSNVKAAAAAVPAA